jgi:hypothetical protein
MQVAMNYCSIQYLSIDGISQEVNTVIVVVHDFGWKSLLDNNNNDNAVAKSPIRQRPSVSNAYYLGNGGGALKTRRGGIR